MDPQLMALLQMMGGAGGTAASAAFPPLAIAQLGLGAIQTGVALKNLNNLRKQRMPQFSDNMGYLDSNAQMWQNRMRGGLDPSTINLFQNQQGMQRASAFRRMQDVSGGQSGSYLGRLAALGNITGGLELAKMSDQARLQAMYQLDAVNRARLAQSNMQVGADRQYRMQQEQAYGRALQSGTKNLATAIDYGLPSTFQWLNNRGSQGSMDPASQTQLPMVTPMQIPSAGGSDPYGYAPAENVPAFQTPGFNPYAPL